MPKLLELLWILCTVSPFIVLTIRTLAVCRKAREQEEAWKVARRYIFGLALSDASGPPEPAISSAQSLESDVHAMAA